MPSPVRKKLAKFSGKLYKPSPRHRENPIRRSRKTQRSKKNYKISSKSRKSSRSIKRSRRSKKSSKRSGKCKKLLQKKIEINMKEYKDNKRWKSPKQAIAVSYAQAHKINPKCKF